MSPLETIKQLFRESMGMAEEDLTSVDFVVAAYASTFLPGDRERTWGVLVGPPASGKTELLRIFRDYDPKKEPPRRTVEVDDLTEHAFSSAWRDEENPEDDKSILAKLDSRRHPYGPKVLVLSDMTTLLKLPKERRARLFGQLRRAYDGDYNNHAGQLGHIYYDLGFGFVGACTEAIDQARKSDQALGERIVLCRTKSTDETLEALNQQTTKAMDWDPHAKKIQRAALRSTTMKMMEEFIERVSNTPEFRVKRPQHLRDQLSLMGSIMTVVRTVPVSNETYTAAPERGSRIAQQLVTWLDARAAIDGRDEWNEGDLDLARRIIQDTLPPDFMWTLQVLWGKDGDAKEFSAEALRTDSQGGEGMYRQYHQWVLSGLLWEHGRGNYSLSPDYVKGMRKCDFLKGLDQ